MPALSSANIQVRRARESELDALAALESQVFDYDRMSRAQFHRHLRSASAAVLVAVRGVELLGSAIVFFRRGSQVARLYSLAVAAAARGAGLGRRLLQAVEHAARLRGCARLRLEVRVDNAAAAQLYESATYRRFARIEAYYDDGADAWRYEKELCA